MEPAPNLLETSLVRVIPVGAGVDRVELVDKSFTRSNGFLCKMRHAIHGMRHAHPMPMNGGFLCQGVLDCDPQSLSLAEADLRAGNDPVVMPYRRLAERLGPQAHTAWCSPK